MGMNYGKISENLIHRLSKKDESISARVRKDDGSFIHFLIEEKFITDHFNMYVDFIHLIQESSDVRLFDGHKLAIIITRLNIKCSN